MDGMVYISSFGRSLWNLLRTSSLVTALSTLDHTHCITSLLSSLVSSLMREHLHQLHDNKVDDEGGNEKGKAVLTFLEQLLDEVQLEEQAACNLIRSLVEIVLIKC